MKKIILALCTVLSLSLTYLHVSALEPVEREKPVEIENEQYINVAASVVGLNEISTFFEIV